MQDLIKILSGYSDVAITAISIVAVLVSLIGAFKSGALNRIMFGSLEVERGLLEETQAGDLIGSITSSDSETIPFETEQLANYYSQVLAQSKVSFWFSLVFASIGFFIIVLAAFMHSEADTGSTIARFVAGGVVDAVAALFFVQSKRAQEAMSDFFDKLRRDRNHVEARKLCESLGSGETRDALRVQLALHYAEVSSPDDIARSIYAATLRAHNAAEDA